MDPGLGKYVALLQAVIHYYMILYAKYWVLFHPRGVQPFPIAGGITFIHM